MDNDLPNADSLARLETIVREAKDYVHPSDDLRPRTVEAAREQATRQRGRRTILTAAAAVLFAAIGELPARLLLSPAASEYGLTSSELHSRALDRAVAGQIDPAWALYEAFVELRRNQADQFGGLQD